MAGNNGSDKMDEVTVEVVDTPLDKTSMADHWKSLAACTLVSMCPFQYGIDFGLIGGLQAMKGCLEVRIQHAVNRSCVGFPVFVIVSMPSSCYYHLLSGSGTPLTAVAPRVIRI